MTTSSRKKKTRRRPPARPPDSADASLWVLKFHQGGTVKATRPTFLQLVPDGFGGVVITDERGFSCQLNRSIWIRVTDPNTITYEEARASEDEDS